MALLDDLFAAGNTPWARSMMAQMLGDPSADLRAVAPPPRQAPAPAPRPETEPTAASVPQSPAAQPTQAAPQRPDLSGGGGPNVMASVLRGVGGPLGALGAAMEQSAASEKQTKLRNDTYDMLIRKGVDSDVARMAVMDPSVGKVVIPRALGLGGSTAADMTKNAPTGYMWNDPADPRKGVSPIPGSKQDATISLTPAQKKVDEAFGKEYEAFAMGGFADVEKGIGQLRGVLGELRDPNGPNLTGPVLGLLPDAVKSFTHPKAIDRREAVEEVVQRNLRAVLGAQFTQKEGERLIARAYNPSLSEEENAVRLERLISSIEKAYAAKVAAAKHFEEHGTLSNYNGSLSFGLSDIERGMEQDASRGEPKKKAAQPATPPIPGARQAPDGNFYVEDPNRPGKYLMVSP